MKRLLAILAGIVATGGVGRAGPAADRASEACLLVGETLLDGRPVAAEIDVRLQLENPRFPHAFHWTSEARERQLLAPRLDAPAEATTRSGADGRFEIGGLPPGRHWVLARTDAGAWAGVHVPLHVPGQHERVVLDLVPGTERLSGRFVHEDGRPFHGFVAAGTTRDLGPDRDDVHPETRRWVATDADGRFAIAGLPRGPVHVTALWPGRLRQPMGTVALPYEGEFEASVDAVDRPVRGRVTDIESDDPVAGASVIWDAYGAEGRALGVETTAGDGTYSLPAPVEVGSIHVRKVGYAERYLKSLEGVGRGTVRIRRGVRVTGLVRAAGGGALVAGILVERRGPGSYWYQWTRAVTDAQGRFTLEDQAPGDGPIYARGAGWVPVGLPGLDDADDLGTSGGVPRPDPLRWVVEAGRPLEVALEVERSASLEGRVLDDEGRPVAGVPLIVEETDDPAFSWDGHGVPPVAASGPDGAFRIDGLLAGTTYEVGAHPAGGAPIEGKATARRVAPPAESLLLRLPPPHWILVHVVDSRSGRPVAGAWVELMARDRRDDRQWRTDATGLARVGPVGPVSGDVDVRARGYIDANQRPVPAATREGTEATVALDAALTIEGRVAWPDGSPAAGAIAYVAEISDDVWKTYRGKKRCDAAGRFVAEEVNDIDYRVSAVAWRGRERYAATAVVHGGTEGVVLTLAPAPKPSPDPPPAIGPAEERPATARLRVVDPRGRPVPRAVVVGGGASSGVEDGEIRFDGPPDRAAFPLWISNATAEDDVPLPVGPLRLDAWPKDGGDAPVVALPPERAIEGRVTDPEGRAVPRVPVAAVAADGVPADGDEGSVVGLGGGSGVSRSDGTFRIGGLEDLAYSLRIRTGAGFLPPRGVVAARPGTPVDIRLRRSFAATLRVTDPDGRAVDGVEVTAEQGRWCWFSGTSAGWVWRTRRAAQARTDAAGRAVLTDLDPERRYVLEAAPPKAREDLFPEARRSWAPADLTLALRPRGVIRGHVVGTTGGARSSHRILWRDDGAWRSEAFRGDTFTLAIPARGEVELLAGPAELHRPLRASRPVKARTGSEDVSVPWEPGARLRVRFARPRAGEARLGTWVVVEEGPPADAPRVVRGERRAGATDGGAEERVFEGLDPEARYTVIGVQEADGTCARRTHVPPGDAPLLLELTPGASIDGVVEPPHPGAPPGVAVRARPVEGGPVVEIPLDVLAGTGRFHLDGLTPGRWRIGVVDEQDDEDRATEVDLVAGRTTQVEFPAPR